MNNTIVGVDLAKKVIQVGIFKNNKMRSNTEMTPDESLPVCLLFNLRLSYLKLVTRQTIGNKSH